MDFEREEAKRQKKLIEYEQAVEEIDNAKFLTDREKELMKFNTQLKFLTGETIPARAIFPEAYATGKISPIERLLATPEQQAEAIPTGTPTINTKAEYDALPSGTKYIDGRDGAEKIKR